MGQGYAKIAGTPIAMACTQGRPAACDNGDLQRLLRPRAGHLIGGNSCGLTSVCRARIRCAFRRRHRRASARLHQMGRSTGFALSISPSRRCAPTNRTTPPMGRYFSRSTRAGENPIPDGESLHIPKLAPVVRAAGRCRRHRGGGEDAGRGAEPRHHLRSPGAHARRAWRTSSSWPKRCNAA